MIEYAWFTICRALHGRVYLNHLRLVDHDGAQQLASRPTRARGLKQLLDLVADDTILTASHGRVD